MPPAYKQTAPLRAGLSILEREGLHHRRRADRVPMTNSMQELGKIGKEVRRRARISAQGTR